VATRTRAMELFEEYVYLADKPEDYPLLIGQALRENNEELKQKRIAFAHTHTWENSVGELSKCVEQKEKTKMELCK